MSGNWNRYERIARYPGACHGRPAVPEHSAERQRACARLREGGVEYSCHWKDSRCYLTTTLTSCHKSWPCADPGQQNSPALKYKTWKWEKEGAEEEKSAALHGRGFQRHSDKRGTKAAGHGPSPPRHSLAGKGFPGEPFRASCSLTRPFKEHTDSSL